MISALSDSVVAIFHVHSTSFTSDDEIVRSRTFYVPEMFGLLKEGAHLSKIL